MLKKGMRITPIAQEQKNTYPTLPTFIAALTAVLGLVSCDADQKRPEKKEPSQQEVEKLPLEEQWKKISQLLSETQQLHHEITRGQSRTYQELSVTLLDLFNIPPKSFSDSLQLLQNRLQALQTSNTDTAKHKQYLTNSLSTESLKLYDEVSMFARGVTATRELEQYTRQLPQILSGIMMTPAFMESEWQYEQAVIKLVASLMLADELSLKKIKEIVSDAKPILSELHLNKTGNHTSFKNAHKKLDELLWKKTGNAPVYILNKKPHLDEEYLRRYNGFL